MYSIVFLGGGIKGSAMAALAALSGQFDVTLVERDRIGSGTTSTNHGRLHLGTAGWGGSQPEPPGLIQRRRQACELVRQLPDAVTSKQEALYCFEDDFDAANFHRFLFEHRIPHCASNDFQLPHRWIDTTVYERVFQVPEYSFNPARLAGRFAQTCLEKNGKVLTGRRVSGVDRCGETELVVSFDGADPIHADLVVNTLSRWCDTISVPLGSPELKIMWERWRLLCLHSAAIPELDCLDQVVVIVDRDRKVPSAIPHGEWITLDYRETPRIKLASREDDAHDWRAFDQSDASDRANYTAVARVFSPLAQLGAADRRGKLFSLAGTQGRIDGASPGSRNCLLPMENVNGYFVSFGGQASTALLDAIENVETLQKQLKLTALDRNAMMHCLKQELAPLPIAGYMPMRWEQGFE